MLRPENIVSLAGVVIAAHAHIGAVNGAVGAGNKYGCIAAKMPYALAGIVKIQLILGNVICAVTGSGLGEGE